MRTRSALLTLVIGLAILLAAAPAKAEASVAIDWMRLLVQADTLARGGIEYRRTERPVGSDDELRRLVPNELLPSARRDTHLDPSPVSVTSDGAPWIGVAPHVAFVARDWGNAYRLAGDRLSLMDALRLSRSTRMVMSRMRLGGGRLRPFMQLGLGQWRTDPSVLPLMPRRTELAAHAGLGVEICPLAGWHIAAEANVTQIYREAADRGGLPLHRMVGAMVASAIKF